MVEFVSSFLAKMPAMSSKNSCRVYIDDFIFRLHYLITAKALYFLSVFSVVLLMFDWVQCFSHSESIPNKMANVFCWMQNTFVLPGKVEGTLGEDIAHQGIDQATPEDQKVYISYYQWLPLFLLFQGCCFELGHFLWKGAEHSEMHNMVTGFQFPIAKRPDGSVMSDGDIDRGVDLVATCIKKGWSKKPWTNRPWIFLLCMMLNWVNSGLQIYLLTTFFQLEKLNSGWEVFPHMAKNYFTRSDPLVAVFPRMVKCLFHQFGAGGSVQTHDILCLLPFNVYTEKFFAVCLVWYYVLTALTILGFLVWFVILVIPSLRKLLASVPCLHMFPQNDAVSQWVQRTDLSVGNWFVMWLLCKNVHSNHLEKLLPLLQDVTSGENSMKKLGYGNKRNFDDDNQKTKLLDDDLRKRFDSNPEKDSQA